MLAAIVTFLLCAAIIIGAYWMFVVRPEDAGARAVRRRLTPPPAERPERSDLRKAASLSALQAFDLLLARVSSATHPLHRLVRLSGLRVTASGVLLACALTGAVVFLIVTFATSLVWMGLIGAVLATPLPVMYVRLEAHRRMSRLEEQFPQAIELIAVSLRAGHALTTGLLMVAEEVADPLGAEFRLLHDQQNYGKPLPTVLKEFAERVPLLDVRILVTAVLTQRETGGNLAEVLDKLSALIRERFNVRRQVRAVSAHGRITGWVLACLPPAIAGVLFLFAPQHIMILVTDPVGMQLTAAAVVLQIAGTLAIRRIVRIEL